MKSELEVIELESAQAKAELAIADPSDEISLAIIDEFKLYCKNNPIPSSGSTERLNGNS